MSNIKTVATNGNGKKPIVSDKLDAGDMAYFQNALRATIEAQAISNAFFAVAKDKYKLGSKDEIRPDGTIVRNPSIEIVG